MTAVPPQLPTPSHQTSRARYSLLAVLIVAGLVPFLLIQGPLSSPLKRAGLLAQPGHFTAIFFPHPESLPTTASPGGPLVFAFAIRSHTPEHVRKRWAALIVVGNQRLAVATGSIEVGPEKTSAVTVRATMPPFPTRATVRAILVDSGDSLQFFVDPLQTGRGD
jgi:hypothetical protein